MSSSRKRIFTAALRTGHVACSHYATENGVVYETTSATDIAVPY